MDFAVGVYLSETQNPIPPPPRIRLYSILIHTGKGVGGGRVEPERRLEGQQFTKLGRKYQHDCLYLQAINSDNKHMPHSPFTDQYDDDILFWCLCS